MLDLPALGLWCAILAAPVHAQYQYPFQDPNLPEEVRVTNIAPGMAETEFSKVRFKGDEEKAHTVYSGTEPLLPSDIADLVVWVATLPPRVNINSIEVMPVCQAWGPFAVHRDQNPG